jgi:Kazal-type serine protease inhibitor domain
MRSPILHMLFPPAVASCLVACSAASNDGARSSASERFSSEDQGISCLWPEDCPSGSYCAPNGDVCGWGSCAPSPQACPMLDRPVCGCDGITYLNFCWATIGQPGQPGTTSSGDLVIAPTMSAVVGTWRRVNRSGGTATRETLVLASDGSFVWTESTWTRGPWSDGTSGETSQECQGTFTLSTVGISLQAPASENGGSRVTEFVLENTCPIGDPPVLVGEEPLGSGVDVTLVGP